jgi:Domain of unknown function (DUF4907)
MISKPFSSRRQWLFTALILLAVGALIFAGYCRRANWKKEHILLELKAVQNLKGWGYDISTNGRIYIHQPIIPAISGAHAFRTREDALAVGQKVVDRLSAGQVPMVTAAEIREMRLLPDSVMAQDSAMQK